MIRKSSRTGTKKKNTPAAPTTSIDFYRAFVFPNNIRKYRHDKNIGTLLQLAQHIPSITYIRLSKIERGEIFPRSDEVARIAAFLDVDPSQLLIDIDEPGFDIASWAIQFQDPAGIDPVTDSMAVLLAAALRARRAADNKLSIAAIETDYGIAPVILSRLENAYKPIERWNEDIRQALYRLFRVADAGGLQAYLAAAHTSGALSATLPLVANPETRRAKTRAKVAALRAELDRQPSNAPPPSRRKASLPLLDCSVAPTEKAAARVLDAIHASESATVRLVPVFGAPLNDGLIARIATGEQVEAPRNAGPRAYGLRICRPTLGSGLPGRSIVVVDPDRFPSAGGLAVVQEAAGLRLLSITFDRQGRMLGYSEHPDREIVIDDIEATDVATVLSAQFE